MPSTSIDPARCVAGQPAPPEVQDETEERVKEKLGPLYRVICHDDPITTTDFVVDVLRGVFRLTPAKANEIMLLVHYTGAALVARYPKTLAETRVDRARTMARARKFPLTFSIEKDV